MQIFGYIYFFSFNNLYICDISYTICMCMCVARQRERCTCLSLFAYIRTRLLYPINRTRSINVPYNSLILWQMHAMILVILQGIYLYSIPCIINRSEEKTYKVILKNGVLCNNILPLCCIPCIPCMNLFYVNSIQTSIPEESKKQDLLE